MTMTNSFIIEHDPVTDKWCTHVWITGLHTAEDQYLGEGSNETHDDLDAACARIKAWKEAERIVAPIVELEAPSPDTPHMTAISVGEGFWATTKWAVCDSWGWTTVYDDASTALNVLAAETSRAANRQQ